MSCVWLLCGVCPQCEPSLPLPVLPDTSPAVPSPRRVIVAGGTGLLGVALCRTLAVAGWDVVILSRTPQPVLPAVLRPHAARVQIVTWDGESGHGWHHWLDKAILINLAGTNPGTQRWSTRVKDGILSSRLLTIKAMGHAISLARAKGHAPRAFLQASAVGIYGARGEDVMHEESAVLEKAGVDGGSVLPSGTVFRVATCRQLEEAAALVVANSSTTHVHMRIGHVLASAGGLFPMLELASRCGVRRIGSGHQWVPWIHVEDAARAIEFLATRAYSDTPISGPVNVCSPEPVTHSTLMAELAQHRRRWWSLAAVPARVASVVVGESVSVVLDSQRTHPSALVAARFAFSYPTVGAAIRHLPCPSWRQHAQQVGALFL